MVRIFFILSLILGFCKIQAQIKTAERIISFSGYSWSVRNTINKQGPGPNYFSDYCVQVDGLGRLHLWIVLDSKTNHWFCPEVTTVEKFGFGTYQFVVEGAVDHFDKNIVLGLFNYSGN
ncbi:MAG TPA: hypothetical protein VNW49_01075, partial [Puia sp.]|nr:hypothetical protein [Puia sp.]